MRKIPNTPIPSLLDPKDAPNGLGSLETPKLTTWELTLKTITPMFGGSAKTREVDSQNPIRPSSVRGHLRYWWRATAGAAFSSAKELFEAEERLWGSATVPGLVSLRIEITSGGIKKPCAKYKLNNKGKLVVDFGDLPSYALFPFQGELDKSRTKVIVEPADIMEGTGFKLYINCNQEMLNSVQVAVFAWVTFGGIGARTRRGCGSLEIVSEKLTMSLNQRQFSNPLTLVPTNYLVSGKLPNATAAWKKAVEIYKEFRQGKDFARDAGRDSSKPAKLGRSRYPEPDTIRSLFPREHWTHQVKHTVHGFPRADLGLPIVFFFPEEGPKESFSLETKENSGGRFASPVITKAIKVNDGYAPAIILLDSPSIWQAGDLVIRLENQKQTINSAQVKLTEAERKEVTPMAGKPIREALIEYAKFRGFTEVSL